MNSFFEMVGHVMVLSGLFVAFAAQLIIFVTIFKDDVFQAVLALMIPGYAVYYIWRSEKKQPRLLGLWLLGIALCVVGTIINAYTT